MKSTELRVGNLVYTSYEGVLEVININSEGFDYVDVRKPTFKAIGRHELEYVKPIPLTEDWLIWFGFEKRESSTCDSWYIGTNEITHDWLFDIVWLHRPELINAPNFPFYRNGRHLIQYVHQLQNLYFALTGKELTLNNGK